MRDVNSDFVHATGTLPMPISDDPTAGVAQLEEELRSRINVARAVLSTRTARRLTQAQLAQLVGTKQARISEVESLEGNVRFDTLDRIARALGLEVRLTPRATISAGPAHPIETPPLGPSFAHARAVAPTGPVGVSITAPDTSGVA